MLCMLLGHHAMRMSCRSKAKDHVGVVARSGDAVAAAQAPDAELLQEFLGRLPIIFNVAILSPHGFFGQKDVLGKPDTGGQVRQ